jgi:integral membrane protein
VRTALGRYRVMAYVVGTGLLVLLLVAMPLKYLGHDRRLIAVVGPLHGALFVVYLVATLDLARLRRWRLVRTLLVMVAGTVPFVSFLVERRVAGEPVTARG